VKRSAHETRLKILKRLGTSEYWNKRARWQFWRDRISRAQFDAGSRVGEAQETRHVLAGIVGPALLAGGAAIVTFVALELAASAVAARGSGIERVTRSLSEADYATFVGALVGAQAVFLALFYTTVGVIASTAYAGVPAEIRTLFVRERSSRVYAQLVTWSLVFGILLLATGPLHYRPHAITVAVFGALALVAVLALVRLGTDLFKFFDLSSISTGLPRQFARAVKVATVSGSTIPDEPRQQAAHQRAASALAEYDQLTTLLVIRKIREARAPGRLIEQLLGMWLAYGGTKAMIPTTSRWFALTPAHPNWLTLDATRLETAITTRTNVQPTLAPDPLWVESRIADAYGRLLRLLVRQDAWSVAMRVIDFANNVVGELASRFQVEEALLLANTTIAELTSAHHEDAEDEAAATITPADRTLYRMAAVDRSALALTEAWLGLVRGVRGLDVARVTSDLDESVDSASGPTPSARPGVSLPTSR